MAASNHPASYRWVVLALGAVATASLAAVQGGLRALGPAFQEAFALSVVEVTGLFTAFSAGTVATVYAWGALADRLSERLVLAVGLSGGALALTVVARADGYATLLAAAVVTGMLAVAAVGGSGRAVFGWFPRTERGMALGLRQTAVPLGAAAASFILAPLAAATSLDTALLVLAGAMLSAALAAAIWMREPPAETSAAPPAPPAARDPRVWRLGVASGLLLVGQVGITSLLVLYLFGERGWSATAAAFALGFTQLGGAAARIAAGRWSDRRDARIGPFRTLAAAAGVLLLAAAALSAAPDALFVPVVVAGGVAVMSGNALSFTAAAEISGRTQAGRAMGLQNTVMRVAATAAPVSLGALAAGWSWAAAFAVMGLAPLAGRALLTPLVADEDRRRVEREARLAARAAAQA